MFNVNKTTMASPILWYKLSEDTANIGTDSSGSSLNMTNVNVVSINDTSTESYGAVADFSGGTLTLPSASVPSALQGTSRSWSFWVESNVVTNTQMIDMGTRSGVGDDFGIEHQCVEPYSQRGQQETEEGCRFISGFVDKCRFRGRKIRVRFRYGYNIRTQGFG